MFLTGTVVNGILIIAGALIGTRLNRISEGMKATVMYAISLAVMVLGLQMGFKSENFLIVIMSLVLGAVTGEALRLDERLNALGGWIEKGLGSREPSSVSQGFVTATLIFAIGAMAIIGALDSGLRGDHDVLYTKAVIDGFTALVLSATLGIGVVFSAIPVMLYEGAIAGFATQIDRLISPVLLENMIVEVTATGGVMIFAIGINLAGLASIKVANMLPSIVIAVLMAGFLSWMP